jgi:ankyrin repeat protein
LANAKKRAGVAILAFLVLAGCHHPTASTSTAAPAASDVTEFDSAVRDGDTAIISRLIKAKPEMINAKDENGKTSLTIATEKGDQETIDYLRRHGAHE